MGKQLQVQSTLCASGPDMRKVGAKGQRHETRGLALYMAMNIHRRPHLFKVCHKVLGGFLQGVTVLTGALGAGKH